MSFWQELQSWMFPAHLDTAQPPKIGGKAPTSGQLSLPAGDGKSAIVVFLRHCGCPFAEKTFRRLRMTASQHPEIHCIAISHSTSSATGTWLHALGGAENVGIIVDDSRQLYAQWGLGASSFWHFLSPWQILDVVRVGWYEGIWNRPTESGSRWQTSGFWAVDGEGRVRWGRCARQGSDIPDLNEAVDAMS